MNADFKWLFKKIKKLKKRLVFLSFFAQTQENQEAVTLFLA